MHSRKRNLFFFLLLALIIIFHGCSHKVASIFFDGVPDKTDSTLTVQQNSVKPKDTVGQSLLNEIKRKERTYFHPPYQNKKCKICHDPSSPTKLVQEQPALCYNCHDDFTSTYKYLHGPVSGGYCTSCHSPHQSENPKLVLRKGEALCLFCHDSKALSADSTHATNGLTNCMECHDPHGGSNEYFIKEGKDH
jgi:predicted CXXCH cytochrome family protein